VLTRANAEGLFQWESGALRGRAVPAVNGTAATAARYGCGFTGPPLAAPPPGWLVAPEARRTRRRPW